MFSLVLDGFRVLDFVLGGRLNRFEIGDVLEVKGMMFLMWLINFLIDSRDVGDVSSKDSSFGASDRVH
jgi:hypothetical protein